MIRVAIYIQDYRFCRPPILSENDFWKAKAEIESNRQLNLSNEDSFFESFPILKYGLIVFAISMVLGIFWEWFSYISIICFFILAYSLFTGFADTLNNYFRTFFERYKFYRALKRDIVKADDYETFLKARLQSYKHELAGLPSKLPNGFTSNNLGEIEILFDKLDFLIREMIFIRGDEGSQQITFDTIDEIASDIAILNQRPIQKRKDPTYQRVKQQIEKLIANAKR